MEEAEARVVELARKVVAEAENFGASWLTPQEAAFFRAARDIVKVETARSTG